MPKQKKKLLNLTDYAKHRGVTFEAVRRAVEWGRISCKIINGRKMFDPEKADKEWEQNTDTNYLRGSGKKEEKINPNVPSFQESRAMREAFQARIAGLEWEEKKGSLISIETVKKEAITTASLIRNALKNIPQKVAAEIAAETDPIKIEMILTEEIDFCLQELSEYEKKF